MTEPQEPQAKADTTACYAVGETVVVVKNQECWNCGSAHPRSGDRVVIREVGKESVRVVEEFGRVFTVWKRDLETVL